MRRQQQRRPTRAARLPRRGPFLEPLESRVFLTADDQISEAILKAIPSTTNATIDVGTDVDMYRFAVSAEQTVGFDTDVAGLDSYIRLFNSSGTQLAFSDDDLAPDESGSTLASYLEYKFTSAGTYYLGVSSWNNGGYNPITGTGDASGTTTGPYTLILTNIIPNQPPTIGSVSDTPDPVTAPGTFTLTANSVADPGGGSVANVQFFRETNGMAGFQLGDDTFLSTDTSTPYTATVTTSALPAGTHTYYARPNDTLGLGGNVVSTTHTLNGPAGSITGTVWNDANSNKVRDAGEGVLPGWVVFLDTDRDQVHDAGEISATTNPSGVYTFSGLTYGTYYVTTKTQTGWEQTSPGAPGFINPASASVTTKGSGVTAVATPKFTTTGSTAPVYPLGEPTKYPTNGDGTIGTRDAQSNPLIRLTNFQSDPRFSAIRGQGYSVAVLDSGINASHPAFGGRVVYQQDFADGDMNAADVNGHGTNVSSIVGSQDGTNPGMAPQVNLIALKVFTDAGGGNFTYVEQALQWVVANATAYNIAAINMSLGDTLNHTTTQSLYGCADEMAALASMNVIVVSASGNDFHPFNSVPGVSYPAADPNSLAIGAVYDANIGSSGGNGAIDSSTAPDRITGFTQRSWTMVDAFAPGAIITGAGTGGSGSTSSMGGTSQASPHIAGIAALAQQLAMRDLGRRLSMSEFAGLLKQSGVLINDGDDETDNVTNTGAYFRRVDVLKLGEAIQAMGPGAYTQAVTLTHGENDAGIDFGAHATAAATGSISGVTFDDYDGDDIRDGGEPGRAGITVYIDTNGSNARDAGEPMAVTDGTGAYTIGGLTAGTYDVRQEVPIGFISGVIETSVPLGAGANVTGVNFGEFRVVHTGTSGNDVFTLRRDAGGTKLEVVAGAVTWSKLLTAINALSSTGIDFTPDGGDDTLTVDYSNGAPIPTNGIDYDGGTQSTTGDRLIVAGGAAGDTFNVIGNSVTRSGDANAPLFAGVERIIVNGNDGDDTLNVNAAVVPPIEFNGGLDALDTDTLNVNAGTFTFAADANVGTANLRVNVTNAGSAVVFNATQHLAALTLNAGAVATLSADGNRYLFTKGLVIQPGGTLNLSDNDLLWDYTGSPSQYATMRSFLLDGRLTKTGASDTTIAPVDNAQYGATEWLGQQISPTTMIGKYTYFGDANLSGSVTSDDYVSVDVNLGMDPGNKQWVHGDFNLNGSVTSDDYVAIDTNLGKGIVTPLATAEPVSLNVATVQTVALTTTAPATAPAETPTIEQSAAGKIRTAWAKLTTLKKISRR